MEKHNKHFNKTTNKTAKLQFSSKLRKDFSPFSSCRGKHLHIYLKPLSNHSSTDVVNIPRQFHRWPGRCCPQTNRRTSYTPNDASADSSAAWTPTSSADPCPLSRWWSCCLTMVQLQIEDKNCNIDTSRIKNLLTQWAQAKLLGQSFVFKERILVKVEVNAIARFDVLEFLDFQFGHEVKAFLLLFLQNAGYLWMIDELRRRIGNGYG